MLPASSLDALRLPITLLAGEEDRLTPVAGAEQLTRALAGAVLTVLPRCGHQIPLERPDAVVRALLDDVVPPIA
jgi:abhydrolase domain-containing protein 8